MMLPLRQQLPVRNNWLRQRLDELLPPLMVREGFDMWLIVCREYNEDPVLMSLLPQPALSARRRTILLFTLVREDGTVERLSLDRYGWGEFLCAGLEPRRRGAVGVFGAYRAGVQSAQDWAVPAGQVRLWRRPEPTPNTPCWRKRSAPT